MQKQVRNREITYIHEMSKRNNAKSKRTKHLMQKLHQLSILCDLRINLSIFDPKINKLMEYATDKVYKLE